MKETTAPGSITVHYTAASPVELDQSQWTGVTRESVKQTDGQTADHPTGDQYKKHTSLTVVSSRGEFCPRVFFAGRGVVEKNDP